MKILSELFWKAIDATAGIVIIPFMFGVGYFIAPAIVVYLTWSKKTVSHWDWLTLLIPYLMLFFLEWGVRERISWNFGWAQCVLGLGVALIYLLRVYLGKYGPGVSFGHVLAGTVLALLIWFVFPRGGMSRLF